MNTIFRSEMEREIGPKWECDYVTITHPHGRVLAIDNGDVVFRRDGHAPMAYPLREITHVRKPGGEWLEVVDDPKVEVGSVWLNNYSVDGVCVVRGVADGVVTYDFNGPCGLSKHHTWPLATWAANTTPISDSRIIEGMDAGRRRRFFITNEFRKARQGEYWLRRSGPQKGEVEREDCRECALAGDILIPLNFLDPAPSITPATPCTSSVHNETELEGGTKRLADALEVEMAKNAALESENAGLREIVEKLYNQSGLMGWLSMHSDGLDDELAEAAKEAK